MKKLFIFFLFAGVFTLSAFAQNWVTLTRTEPAAPEITLTRSDNHQVNFTMGVPGFFSTPITENGTHYQRISIQGYGTTGVTGEPEIPVITHRIAVPECSGIAYSVNITATQTLTGYTVYPVPNYQPNNEGALEEVFAINPSAYLQNAFTPGDNYAVTETGALRSQKFVTLNIHPVQFNPATGQLQVATEIEITLTFNKPVTDVNTNLGAFSKTAFLSFLNFPDNGNSFLKYDKAFEKPGFVPGKVNWITIEDPAQADTLLCDYLIITVPEFFNPQNADLQRLAEHRAYYNGYDVAIVNVADIFDDNVGFYYEDDNNPPNFKDEQRIRTFIRQVYEGKNAHHMGDSCLAFVLLVGDYDDVNGGIPGATEHGIYNPYYPLSDVYPSDYYYSCLTKNATGEYDEFGDLCIGRFSVEDEIQLFNMVKKTINHETNFSDKSWRKTAGFTHIWQTSSYTDPLYNNFLSNLLDTWEWNYTIVDSQQPGSLKIPTINYFNEGVVFIQYASVVDPPNSWTHDLDITYFSSELSNEYMTPFISTIGSKTAQFDNVESLGEFLTRYDSIKGAVGYIGATRDMTIPMTSVWPDDAHLRWIPNYLFSDTVSIAGELLLTTKYLGTPAFQNYLQHKHAYNLLGDPALNILVEDENCERTLHTTLVVNSEVTIDCNRYCDENVSIIVQPGAKLIIDGATITNINGKGMWEGITVLGDISSRGVVELINGATIENAKIGIHSIDGGWMKTDSACFINNAISVQIDPGIGSFLAAKPISFINTQFVVNDSYFGNVNDFGPHVKLSNSITVKVLGCNFLNENNQLSYSNIGNNTGIWAFNSPVIVDNYVINSVTTPTKFSGLYVAFFSINSGSSPLLSIENSEFVNNVYGIRINTVDYPKVKNNNFDLSILDASGVNTVDVTGYQISENNFLIPNPSPLNSSIGIRIMKSGSGENVVYNNHFSKLNVGILAMDRNSSQGSLNLPGFATGLQFLCNHFEDIKQTDILVGDPSQLADHSIRREQGSSIQPAGNKFINNQPPRVNIGNNSNYRIYYYYSSGVPEENPLYVSGSVDKTPSNYPTGCPGKGGRNLEYELAQYDKWNAEYELWLDKLLATKVGSEEYYVILNEVSYFSGLKDNFYNSILVAAINNKEIDEESKGKFENLRYLFGYRGNYTDYLSITETYLAESNFEEAITTLAKMYKQFEVTEKQMLELKGMETYALWLQQLEKEQKRIYKLSEKELDYLVKYVETNTGRGAVFANNILCVLYNICLEEEPKYTAHQNQTEEETTISPIINYTLQADEKTLLDKITVVPNPTTGELRIVSGELKIDKIEVLDIVGKIVSSHHLITSSSNQKIDISNLNSGIYFIKIITEQGEIVKKVMKQ